ncbi:LytR/AlgR family response regulator transcription factor [Algoriphagus sp. PAP.12]|uniref:LytR/AlgR family response regulator transcription factor n=1 Tax=Algoriphagus sp. PAP.12 TaxID=2996678 RepID=UPI00227A07D9|nr:LytTR family DNA-binding domain-containing protein [Algoriphagus sp. PAP.12]
MEVIKYVIVDDEPIAHRIIEGYAENFPILAKAGNFFNGFEAMVFFKSASVDLIFLDIQMPKLTGYEFLKSLKNPPKVIVTTAYQEFALEGYELDVVDYLLKPFSLDRFAKSIQKVIPDIGPIPIPKEEDSGKIFLKSDKKFVQLEKRAILYVQALGNYSKVFHQEGMLICPDKISDLEAKLGTNLFLRVHKSYLVNTAQIKMIEGNRLFVKEQEIPIGVTYKTEVNRLLGF